jgi:hypothetical protein
VCAAAVSLLDECVPKGAALDLLLHKQKAAGMMAAPGVQGGCGWQGSRLGDRRRQRTLLLLLLLLERRGASAQGRRCCGWRGGGRESGPTR